jgi:rSAM/selenodomain-associated transferase 1
LSDLSLYPVDNLVDKVDNCANSHIFGQNGAVIGLFAKQPQPGRVKTRLSPPLSADQACQLYRVALAETLAALRRSGLPLVICYAGERAWFEQAFPRTALLEQRGDGLGERLQRALTELFAAGYGPVLMAGSDSPDLPSALVEDVVAALADRDVAAIPCDDGGYAVIGLRAPTGELFADIPWSTEGVLEATRRRCAELGLGWHETAPWSDIDQVDDLRRLVARSPATATAAFIRTELAALLR